MAYEVRIYRPARRYLERCDRPTQRRLIERIEALSENPYSHSKLLENAQGKRSSRVGGLRIIFEVDEQEKLLHVLTIAPRGEVYRRLQEHEGTAQVELLTIADIAKRLGLPESTVRYYRDRFSEYVPSVGEGRRRRYRPEAVEVLRFIADALRNDRTATEVAEALSRMFPKTVDVHDEPQQRTAAAQQQPTAMTYEPQQDRNQTAAVMFAFMAQQAQVMQQIAASLDKLVAQAETADALRKEVERLRNELAETATARQQAEEKAQAALENAVMAKQTAAQARDEARKREEERRKREEERDRQVMQAIRQLQEAQRSGRPWWRRMILRDRSGSE